MKVGIIGGGPAGLATAIKLNQYNIEVIVWEAGEYADIKIGEHLAAEAYHEFQKLGVPQAISQDHSIPCLEVKNGWKQVDSIPLSITARVHHGPRWGVIL